MKPPHGLLKFVAGNGLKPFPIDMRCNRLPPCSTRGRMNLRAGRPAAGKGIFQQIEIVVDKGLGSFLTSPLDEGTERLVVKDFSRKRIGSSGFRQTRKEGFL
jgi:hypothetical protein